MLLLGDENAACNATSRVFRSMWELVIDGIVTTEEEFYTMLTDKTITYCKTAILKKDPKAFRVPVGKSFVSYPYAKSKLIKEEKSCLFILRNLPPLCRFIYTLHFVFNYDENSLARIFKMSEEVIRQALDAEETNIKRLLTIGEKIVSLTAEDFHRELCALEDEICLPTGVDHTVAVCIDAVYGPILEESRKKRNKIRMCIGIVILCLALLSLGVWGIYSAVNNSATSDDASDDDVTDTTDTVTYTTDYTATHYADIEIAGYGTITVALDSSMAPETVENFVSLAESGFYDGLTFHRIVEGFIMQGGDPNKDGTGGNTDEDGNEINITGEFYYNGSSNMLSHVRGAISMARGDAYDSASSQFFIVHEDSASSLDGLYAVFGYVIEGMDIVDAICESAEPIEGSDGLIEEDAQPVISSIVIRVAENSTEEE